jgi:condensin complex subunit 2
VTRNDVARRVCALINHVNRYTFVDDHRMAPTRRARSPQESHPYGEETDQESDQDTPKPRKNGLKKRLSEYNPENDGNFTSEAGRAPLRSVNINDDAAEKRRRRKSAKPPAMENAMGEQTSEVNVEQDGESSRMAKQKQPLQSIAPALSMNVPKDIMSSNFEEWMKMATDNVRGFHPFASLS